jgi:hypothetical protein
MSNVVQCIYCCIVPVALLKSEAFIREAFPFHFSNILQALGAETYLLKSKVQGSKAAWASFIVLILSGLYVNDTICEYGAKIFKL